jgi:tRNA(Ile)-lysidine synthase
MLDKVLDTINRYKLIENGDKIVAALSGGPDSVALLHALISLSEKLDITVYALHVNHMLRGEESDGDEEYVKQLCERFGIPLKICRHDIRLVADSSGITLEEAGREIRYRELSDYADSIDGGKVAVAHNRNDQAETVLMNIIRGTGVKGLAGIGHIRGRIIRPLLDISREDIEEYCRINELHPRTDSTNLKSDFTRNRIRLELIPYLDRSFNTDIIGNVCRLASIARMDNDFIEEEAAEAFNACVVDCAAEGEAVLVSLDSNKLSELHPSLAGRVIRKAAEKVTGDIRGLGLVHINDISELDKSGRTGAYLELPKGLRAGMEYGVLKLYTEQAVNPPAESCEPEDRKLEIPGITVLESKSLEIHASIEENFVKVDKCRNMGYNSLVQFFDYERLNLGINIRHRKNGDIFSPYLSKGTKKLKEYFIDEKIPRGLRDTIPLIACGKEIIWIIGYKISDKFKVTENTKNILRLELVSRRKNDRGI